MHQISLQNNVHSRASIARYLHAEAVCICVLVDCATSFNAMRRVDAVDWGVLFNTLFRCHFSPSETEKSHMRNYKNIIGIRAHLF